MKATATLLAAFAVVCCALVSIAAQVPVAQQRFTEKDFARLKWIEGQWVGSGYSKPFYEAYKLTSPTRLETQSFADESFATATRAGSIYLEGGRILRDNGESQYVAVRLTDTSVEFEPVGGGSNSFSWTRKSPDAWTAVLKAKGRPDTIYEMTRVKKPR
jgi:hypothetical protein